MINNLSDNLTAEAEGDSSLTAHNNIYITSVIGFLSAMSDILDVRTFRSSIFTLELSDAIALGAGRAPAHALPGVLQICLRPSLRTSATEHPPTTHDSHGLAPRRFPVSGKPRCL